MPNRISFGTAYPDPIKTSAGWHVPLGIISEQLDSLGEGLVTNYSAYEVVSPTLFAHDIEQALAVANLPAADYSAEVAEAVEFGTTPNWQGFNTAMVMDSARTAYDISIKDTYPVLSSKLDLAYSMVNDKGPETFQAIYGVFCTVAQVSLAHREQWAALATANHLPRELVQILLNGAGA